MIKKHKPLLHLNSSFLMLILCSFLLLGCESFVEIDPPNNQITGELVFEDPSTVNAALAEIYSQLRGSALTNGGTSGLSYLMGHYADELDLFSTGQPEVQTFYENNVLPTSSIVSNLWNSSYNLIYSANTIIEGVENSQSLTQEDKEQFLGEAYFLRAFIHFYLMNLFGDIPYVNSTDYVLNSNISRLVEIDLFDHIKEDLLLSKSLLSTTIATSKSRPNQWVSSALLARVYLYEENWDMARSESTEIISSGAYELNNDITQVFLKNSSETLWQFDTRVEGNNTVEAMTYIFVSAPPPNTAVSPELINSFEAGDARFSNWLGEVSDGTNSWYYAYKYKINTTSSSTEECSIVMRLAELYLIAAEANAQLGNTSDALNYLNSLRTRAALPSLSLTDNTAVLQAVYHERQIEFFVEHGHRWFDLKRTERANNVLQPIKPNWNATDVLLPIPQSELILNPNLLPQNEGY